MEWAITMGKECSRRLGCGVKGLGEPLKPQLPNVEAERFPNKSCRHRGAA